MELNIHNCIGVTFDDGIELPTGTKNRRFVFHKADGSELRITVFADKKTNVVPVQLVDGRPLSHQLEAGWTIFCEEVKQQQQ